MRCVRPSGTSKRSILTQLPYTSGPTTVSRLRALFLGLAGAALVVVLGRVDLVLEVGGVLDFMDRLPSQCNKFAKCALSVGLTFEHYYVPTGTCHTRTRINA